ncbi:hypothetical protein [Streptomyces cucumeris]|uniref:hypothetical protein n=1 Tax=Streptomyces cucumeris TaxID=2962890 RepID=UPI0020C8E4A0|nr:hypothetical protein [Streptomyces sp. NEAU-Y11]MCP9209650.1 hypothetical protein [Streptomyces sp. NEAU-Y11]
MNRVVAVQVVKDRTSPEASIRRLVWATHHGDPGLSRSALQTLIQLTAMAHPVGAEGDTVAATFPAADLDRLEVLGHIKLAPSGVVELI